MRLVFFSQTVFALFAAGALAAATRAETTMAMADAKVKKNYPETRRGDQVDDYHGVKVADPYRWLEADVRESPEVAAWVAAQRDFAREYLDALPSRPAIRRRLEELWNFPRYSPPRVFGDRYFFLKNDGLQNQAVLFWARACDGEGTTLVDPNLWAADGTVALGQWEPTDDGKLLAYARQEAGSDWVTIHVLDVETGQPLPDELKWSRHGGMVWNAAGTGFYYARYPEPPEGEQFQAPSINQMIYFHKLGDPQQQDRLIYRDEENPTRSFGLTLTDDDRFLVLTIYRSTDPQTMVMVRSASDDGGKWRTLVGDFEHEYSFVGNDGDRLFFLTDLDAPTKRIVTLSAAAPEQDRNLEVVATDSQATLEGATLLAGKLLCVYLRDVASEIKLFDLAGQPAGEVVLPGVGAAVGFEGRQQDRETFFAFSGYATPTSIYRLDPATGTTTLIRPPQVAFDPEHYESQLEFCKSKDGARIPIIVTQRKGLEQTGDRPTLLYAYGGFSISLTPYFSVEYAAWMERGGAVAVANLRGGGEYGEAWHAAGKKLNKQNVFDDFLAAAHWLIEQKYTSPRHLGIMGGSNGGLLVAAVETQRPDLFGACVPAVGVLDMLRFDHFTAGHFWRDEFGSAENAEEFRALYAYSPYHNIQPGASYPPTLITTADTDDRVVPMHSFKYAAAMQRAQGGEAPILLRVETRAGHGSGLPISKRIDQSADVWSFLWENLSKSD